MKKFYLVCIVLVFHFTTYTQSNYSGNGNNGFGDPIGTSTLSATDNGTDVTFVLTRGSGSFNDFMTIYFDSRTGGFGNTSTFNDQADANRRAISGINGGGRSTVNFPSGFLADFAISVNTGFGGLWSLASGGNNSLGFVKSVGTPSSSTFSTYTFVLSKTDLGIAAIDPLSFNFLITYGNPNGVSGYFRSNEGYGNGLPGTNPGVTDVTYTTFLSYPLIVTPLFLNNFTGSIKNESVELKWTTVSESNLEKFIIQKSANGLTFTDLAEITPKNLPNGASYIYTDAPLNSGSNYYRLIAKNSNGDKAYSKIIRILYGRIDNNLTLFPNPTREFLKVNFMSVVRGSYNLEIFNDAGQKLITQKFEHNGIDRIINITLPTNMKKGPYRVNISNQYEFYKGTFIVQ